MANKYKFGRDCITVNGRDFPARYEVMERDAARDSFFTVVIWATVDGGQEVRIEVPATDKQHGAALAAAQMEAGTLADLAQTIQQDAPTAATEAATDSTQDSTQAAQTATDSTQTTPEAATIEKEEQTMKRDNMKVYNAYFTDHPTQAATIHAANKKEAEKLARQYIQEWGLTAKIDRIERAADGAEPVQQRGAEAAQATPTAAEPVQVQQEAAQAETAQEAAQVQQEAAPEPVCNVQQMDAEPVQNGARAVQNDSSAEPEAPEEPTPETLEEIGGEAGRKDAPTQAATDSAQEAAPEAAQAAPDPKATRGPVPEKTFKNEVIAGNGWSIVFDAGCNRTRVIIADPVKAAARPIVEAAGFYYSKALDSWNKKLTFRAHRAAIALADKLRAALA